MTSPSEKFLKVSNLTLSMLKAFRKNSTIVEKIFFLGDRLARSDSEKLSHVVRRAEYSIYDTYLVDYIEPDFILRGLVPEVAKEAGFPDLVVDAPLMKEYDFNYDVYVEDTPAQIIEAYYRDPKTWIHAFARVNYRKGTLPSFMEMSSSDIGNAFFTEYYSSLFLALLESDPTEKEWREVFRVTNKAKSHETIRCERLILEKQAKYGKQVLVATSPPGIIYRFPDYSRFLMLFLNEEIQTDLSFFECEFLSSEPVFQHRSPFMCSFH